MAIVLIYTMPKQNIVTNTNTLSILNFYFVNKTNSVQAAENSINTSH